MTYLIAGNVVVWLGIGGYLFFLAAAQRNIELKISQLEMSTDE